MISDASLTFGIESFFIWLEIGTPFYQSPELAIKGARYNQKVDMYSLGIIFFEMFYGPFETKMERAIVLNALRGPEIVFPSDWEVKRTQNETKLLQLLLVHSPKVKIAILSIRIDCRLKNFWIVHIYHLSLYLLFF